MARRRTPPAEPPDLRGLLVSWEVYLRAERKAPGTIEGYLSRVRMYLDWCDTNGYDVVIDRDLVTAWIADQLTTYAPGTVTSRLVGIRRYSWWLAEIRGALTFDPLADMKPPKGDEPVIEPLTTEQITALLQACRGRARTLRQASFRDTRDEAAVRLFVDTGMRAGELVGLAVDDVDLKGGMIVIRRGKGGRGRRVAIGPQTIVAIDRYLAKRRAHRLAGTGKLLLGDGGKGWGYDALRKALGDRAAAAGIAGFHIHRLRHTFAHRWLAASGSESGLMAIAGWRRPEMLMRYTRARAEERAAQEARRLSLGDV